MCFLYKKKLLDNSKAWHLVRAGHTSHRLRVTLRGGAEKQALRDALNNPSSFKAHFTLLWLKDDA